LLTSIDFLNMPLVGRRFALSSGPLAAERSGQRHGWPNPTSITALLEQGRAPA
jgi:hypothetical protein